MKRSPLSRYTRLRPMSAKRRRQSKPRRACLAAVAERSGGMCELRIPGVCQGRMVTGHEPLLRSAGGDPTDPAQVLATCAACHRHTHEEVGASRRLGRIKDRYPVAPHQHAGGSK